MLPDSHLWTVIDEIEALNFSCRVSEEVFFQVRMGQVEA